MSVVYVCNLCGEPIDRDSPLVVLHGDGERAANHWRSGWIGHFHADPTVGCWQRILDIIRAADGWGARLDAIPTAGEDAIADARRKHRRDDLAVGDDESPAGDGDRTGEGEP